MASLTFMTIWVASCFLGAIADWFIFRRQRKKLTYELDAAKLDIEKIFHLLTAHNKMFDLLNESHNDLVRVFNLNVHIANGGQKPFKPQAPVINLVKPEGLEDKG